MFTLILPKCRHLHQDKIDHMFKMRPQDALDQDMSIYIVYEDSKKKLFGSCRVNPLCHSFFSQADLVHTDQCQDLKLMEVSCISFDKEGVLKGDPNQIFHTRWFFEGLGIMLETLSMTQALKGFFCVNSPSIHRICKGLGEWSFLAPMEIDSRKGHGPVHTGFLIFDKKRNTYKKNSFQNNALETSCHVR